MENENYKMKYDAVPKDEDHSPTFAVVEHLIQFCEQEMASLIEKGVIGLPQKKSKKDKDKEKSEGGTKIILRSKNDSLQVPIKYETKKGDEIANPTALFKFQKDKESDGNYRLNTCVDASPDAEEPGTEIKLSSKNVSQKIIPQTVLRALCSLQAINIYEQGISIA